MNTWDATYSEVDGIKAEVENAIWEINMYATAYTIAAEDPHAINIQLESFSEVRTHIVAISCRR
jgi:hypothetical protein